MSPASPCVGLPRAAFAAGRSMRALSACGIFPTRCARFPMGMPAPVPAGGGGARQPQAKPCGTCGCAAESPRPLTPEGMRKMGGTRRIAMKKQMVPLCKQSKKAQRAFYRSRRGSWHGCSPVTRVKPSAKQYRRAALKAERCRERSGEAARTPERHFY